MNKHWLVILIVILPLSTFAQGQFSLEWALKNSTVNDSLRDTSLKTKQVMGGSSLTVPDGKKWKIEKLLVSMGSYTMKANSVKYNEVMNAGERISLPIFSTEAQLLDDGQSDPEYILKYREYSLNDPIPEVKSPPRDTVTKQ